MRKTRDPIKKIRDTKGTFPAKLGSIKDRNGMDLAEAEDIKKRWQEYTEELYILKRQVKWALGSITTNKASGGYGIQDELFQIVKDDAVKVLQSICHKLAKLSSGHRPRKGQYSFQSQET